jgi:hypothetical protein
LKIEILYKVKVWKFRFFLICAGKFVPGVYTLAVSEALSEEMQVIISKQRFCFCLYIVGSFLV